jgi:hypothetical protein
LRAWDGDYGEASTGAVVFELLLHHLVPAVEGETVPAGTIDQQGQWSQLFSYLLRDLDDLPTARRAAILREAAGKAAGESPGSEAGARCTGSRSPTSSLRCR